MTESAVIDEAIHAISYVRVSTKDQAHKGGEPEGLSIPAQREAINTKAAAAYGCLIRRHFADHGESARTADRPGLQELLSYLSSNKVDYVFVHKIDRLARNRVDDVEISLAIRQSGAQLVSCTENIDETPSGMLMHGIMSSIAEFYSRNLANEVKKGLRQKVLNGGTPHKAPLGYLNVRTRSESGGDVRVVEIDPVRGPLVKMAFELYATGDYSIDALYDEMAEQGLTSRPTPKFPARMISRGQLAATLRNKYYIGIVTYEGEEYQGRHEPLISLELFDRAQAVLERRSRQGSRDRIHNHYLRGLLFCDRCKTNGHISRLVYTENRGGGGVLYPYYKCMGKQRDLCDLPYLPVAVVEDAVRRFYGRVQLPEDLIRHMQRGLEDSVRDETATATAMRQNIQRRLTELNSQEERLLDLAMDGELPQVKIKERLSKIELERKSFENKKHVSVTKIAVGAAVLQSGLALLNDIETLYDTLPDDARSQLSRAIFERFWIDDRGRVTDAILNEPFSDIIAQKEKAPENFEDLLTDAASLHDDPKVTSWSTAALVAGAGFEPATSGL